MTAAAAAAGMTTVATAAIAATTAATAAAAKRGVCRRARISTSRRGTSLVVFAAVLAVVAQGDGAGAPVLAASALAAGKAFLRGPSRTCSEMKAGVSAPGAEALLPEREPVESVSGALSC